MTIELEGAYKRGRGSVDEYLEQTAIANPQLRLHYIDPENNEREFDRSTHHLPPEPKEIKPHPYGVELGRLITMLKDATVGTISQFLTQNFSRVSSGVARKICETAKLSTRSNVHRIGRHEADALYQAIQQTKISSPATDCISPIGEELLLKGLHQVVPGEFYAAATRPPAVYRGNPFLIEAAMAYGGAPIAQRVSLEVLAELLVAKRCPHAAAVFDQHVRRLGERSGRQNSGRIETGHAAIAWPAEEGRNRRAARRDAQREFGRRPDDERAALCQPRAAAISARRLRDHANDHGHQLAQLRPAAIAQVRCPAGR